MVLALVFGASVARRAAQPPATAAFTVLVFARTTGFRHASIPDGIAAVKTLGAKYGFAVEATEDAARFTDATLAKYKVVVCKFARNSCARFHNLEAGQAPRAILAVGGGTKNRVWAQATSDISGKTQLVRSKTVGASYGDAFLAALAVGDAKPEDIRTWNPLHSEFVPDPANAEIYRRHYAVFRDIYRQTCVSMHRLAGSA
jgi:sugar (pentulose or hexulose) kinase